ncbi:MAG: transposase [Anaerolineales bacterium]
MKKSIPFFQFFQSLFDDPITAKKAAEIAQAILQARSLRLTDIAAKMRGKSAACYKRIRRFLRQVDPRQALWRLFWEQAEFVIGDVTEIARPQARKTAYVGTLQDGKTKGFWVMVLATPYRGRAIPYSFLTYSSKTIAQGLESRNLNHFRLFGELKDLPGGRPLVLDREFSYTELLERLVEEGIHFVIRLDLRNRPPKFCDEPGREVVLTLSPGETVTYRKVWYRGKVCLNVVGVWKKGLAEPLWVMTDLEPEEGLRLYQARMKIEQTFRDLKSLLGMERLMNKQQIYMEKMIALLLLVFAASMLVGERLRDRLYGEAIRSGEEVAEEDLVSTSPPLKKSAKWRRYSGLFVLLKQKWELSAPEWYEIVSSALAIFVSIVHPPVPTHV